MNTALLTYLCFLVIIFLSGMLFFLAYAYHQLVEEFGYLRSQQLRKNSTAQTQASKLVDEANERSRKMIAKSAHRAEEIILNADFFAAQSQQEITEKLKQMSEKQTTVFNKLLADMTKEMQSSLEHINTDITTTAATEVSEMRKKMEQSSATSDEQLRQKISDDLKASALDLMKRVSKQVIGKSLTNAESQELVIKAFEEAKQQHVL